MKPRAFHAISLSCFIVVSLSGSAFSADLYWDANGAAGGTGGSGDWNTTSVIWQNGAEAGGLLAWTNGNVAVLGGTYGTLSTRTGITVNGLRVNSTASGTAPYIIQNGTGGTFGFTGTGVSIDVASGKSLRFTQSGVSGGSAGISGSGGVTVQGGGTLTISGTNRVYGGSFVVTGTGTTMVFSGTNGLDNGSSSTGLNVRNGGTIEINGTNNYRTGLSLGAVGAGGGTLKLGNGQSLVFQNGGSLSVSGNSKSTILSTLTNTGTATGNFGAIGGNSGTRTFTINSTGDSSGTDLEYSAGWRNGTMVKEGAGVMRLNAGFLINRFNDFTTFANTSVALRVNNGSFVNEGTVKSITEVNGGTVRTGSSSGVFDQVDLLGGVFEISRTSGVFTEGLVHATDKKAINFNGGTLRYVGINTDYSPLFGVMGNAGGSVDTNGNNVTFASQVTGTGTFAKKGSGSLTLNGNHSPANLNVEGGLLAVNGNVTTSNVTVKSSATLGGAGTIGGNVFMEDGSTLAPGNSNESLVLGGLDMEAGSTLEFEMSDGSATGADLVVVTTPGALSLSGATLDLSGAALNTWTPPWVSWTKITLVAYQGAAITSGFTGYSDNTSYLFGSNEWLFDYDDTAAGANFAGDLGSSTRFVTMTLVPEPSAVLLAIAGALPLLGRRRR